VPDRDSKSSLGSEEATYQIVRADSPPGSLALVVLRGGVPAQAMLPESGAVTLGRGPQSDIVLADPSISRAHAILHVGQTLRIEDARSANGVYVRGERLAAGASVTIETGEVVELGAVMIVVVPARADERSVPAGAAPIARAAAGGALLVRDPAMERVLDLVDRVADSPISVLLLGETGVGKELVAEAVHRASGRASKPFLKINCGALSPALLESELFGHERGAFTGADRAKAGLLESADGGTVFLDEIGELPMPLQVKLLRVLEERQVLRVGGLAPRPFDVRFVAATNRDLRAEVERGTFRQDLYYRLNAITLAIPPLRDRPSEILPLAEHFVAVASQPKRASVPAIGREVRDALSRYGWPGNVRELRNVMERAVLLAGDGDIEVGHLPPELLETESATLARPAGAEPSGAPGPPPRVSLRSEVEEVERRRIVEALEQCVGNQTRAAEVLGMPRRTLVAKLKQYGIPRPRKR